MTEKKKKGMNVELNDFDFDEQDIARAQQERAGHAEKVAQFKKDFVPTGSAFKDTAAMSGTSRDVKMMMHYDALLDKAADRKATVRAQDAGLEVERGKIGVDKTRNTLFGRQIDSQMELGVGDLTLRKGVLDLDKDIFGMTKDRYDKYGEVADKLNTRRLAMETQVIGDEFGLEGDGITKGMAGGYLGEGDSVAKPQGKVVDETGIYFDNVPNAPVNESSIPDWLQPKDFRSYNTTGIESLDATLGALNEGVKSMVFRPAYAANDLFGIPSPTAKPRTQRNSLRRKVRKVN